MCTSLKSLPIRQTCNFAKFAFFAKLVYISFIRRKYYLPYLWAGLIV